MSDDNSDPVSIKMLIFLTSELDDAQLELLRAYTEQHSLAEVVKHIEAAKLEKPKHIQYFTQRYKLV